MYQTAYRVRAPWVTTLVVLILLDGLGWGLGILPGLRYALTHQSLRIVRVLGVGSEIRGLSGPFEALGIGGLIVAGLLFVVISGFKVLSAYWVWNQRRDGAVFQLILLGLSVLFWYGFALPLAPLAGIAQIVVMAKVWKSLS